MMTTRTTSILNNTAQGTARAKFFSGGKIETLGVIVEGETVRVWDSVAGYYTTCHSLTADQQKRIARRILRAAK
jgi:hypothetical protein